MLQQLSGVSIVLFIAAGVQTVLLLFIFAKRQIMRFTLRSRRGPHTPIAYDTKKSLRKEIDRRIQVIPRIQYEPHFDECIKKVFEKSPESSYYFRLKAVNDIKTLESQIIKNDSTLKRHPKDNIRGFLINTLSDHISGNGQHMIHEFCDLYEHARHDPSEFKQEEYEAYSKLLLQLMDAANALKSYPTSRKPSPSRTPVKKSGDSRNVGEPRMRYFEDKLSSQRPTTLCVSHLKDNETSV